VTAYREALKEQTRERVPLQWAVTQMNLGTALLTLGEREAGTGRLEEAVTAYDAALQVFVSARSDYYIEGCRNAQNRVQALLAERKQ